MNLDRNKELFSDAILLASDHLKINPIYIEKDYWITRSLKMLQQGPEAEKAIFKGGTSLTKAYRIGNRFSEDIDIAIANADELSGNQLKTLMKKISGSMTEGLTEIDVSGVTSKGSKYRKAVYLYPSMMESVNDNVIKEGQILVEINSYANPYPFEQREISSFLYEYFKAINRNDLIDEYQLHPFSLRVLDKRQTLTEKMVSLLRQSLSKNYQNDLGSKIRHFYDIHYLLQDKECCSYVNSGEFLKDFNILWKHDQGVFDSPEGWKDKNPEETLLINDFPNLWKLLKVIYSRELPLLAFSEIPEESKVEESFIRIANCLNSK